MSFNGYSLGKAYSVLSTWICWKSPNLNQFDIKWNNNITLNSSCKCILELYKDKENVLIRGFWKQLLGTRLAAKFEQVPSTSKYTGCFCCWGADTSSKKWKLEFLTSSRWPTAGQAWFHASQNHWLLSAWNYETTDIVGIIHRPSKVYVKPFIFQRCLIRKCHKNYFHFHYLLQ